MSPLQKELLGLIADAHMQSQKPVSSRVLYTRFGKPEVVEALKSLGGSVVYEVDDHQSTCTQYEPTFLGLLLAPDGEEYESVLASYLGYLERLCAIDAERQYVKSGEVEEKLRLSTDQSKVLCKLILIGNFYSAGASYGGSDGKWQVGVMRAVDDLPQWPSKVAFVHERALKFYDPKALVFWPERVTGRAPEIGAQARRKKLNVASRRGQSETPTAVGSTRRPSGKVAVPKARGDKRFQVALSFPGEHRTFVEKVAEALARKLGRDRVFYDKWYEGELARLDLDTYLQDIYRNKAEVIAVFLCREYEQKQWCGLEWRAVRDLIKHKQTSAIMPIRFDETEIPGLFSIDGYLSVDGRSPAEIASLILERLRGATKALRAKASRPEAYAKKIEAVVKISKELASPPKPQAIPPGEPLPQLSDDEVAILKLLAQRDGELIQEATIATSLGWSTTKCRHYLYKLDNAEYIFSHKNPYRASIYPGYGIWPKGREYLIQRNLV